MNKSKFHLWLCALTMISSLANAEQKQDSLEQQVKDTEIAFAATMTDRDFEAFAHFIDDEAVFFGGNGPLLGKQKVLAAWQKFFEQEAAPFSWQPKQVVVLASGKLAHSSGPVFDPQGKAVMEFNSIWRLNDKGQWKVVFDKGSPLPKRPPEKKE